MQKKNTTNPSKFSHPMKKKLLGSIILNIIFIIGVYFIISKNYTPIYNPLEEALTQCFSSDTRTTLAQQIHYNILDGWHSSLFLLEGQILNNVIHYFSGTKINALFIIWIIFMLWTHAATISLAYIQHTLILRHWIFTIFPVANLAAIYNLVTTPYVLGLDYVFTCCTICSIGLVYGIIYKYRSKRIKTILVFFLFIVLLHTIQYRKQALLIVPFLLYPLLPFLFSFLQKKSFFKKFTIAIMISCTISCIAHPIFNKVFRVVTNAPVHPMLYSDIRIACELGNQREEYIHEYTPGNYMIGSLYPSFWYPDNRDKETSLGKKYLDSLKKRPMEMFAAKCLQMITFYTGAYIPDWTIRSYEYMYPTIKQNDNAWKLPDKATTCMLSNKYSAYTRLLLIVCAGVIWLYCIRKNTKERQENTSLDILITIGCAASFVYAASFCVITPTWDARFLAPSEMLAIMFLSLWVLSRTGRIGAQPRN